MASLHPATIKRFVLFLGASALNTAFGFAAFSAGIGLGLSNELAVVLGTIAGVLFNFQTYGRVFATSNFARLPHFVGVYAALTLANITLLRAAAALGCGPYLGEALVVAALTPVSFVVTYPLRRLRT